MPGTILLDFFDCTVAQANLWKNKIIFKFVPLLYNIFFIFQYNIKGTVIAIGEIDYVDMWGKQTPRKDITVADTTGNIKVKIYSNLFDAVQNNVTYTMENLSSRSYDYFYLTATKLTVVTKEEETLDTSTIISEIEEPTQITKSGEIISIQCIKKYLCMACKKPVPINPTETSKFLKCSNCQSRGKLENFVNKLTARFTMKTSEENVALVAFHDAIISFLDSQALSQLSTNTDQLEEYFLDLPNITCTMKPNSDLVTKMALA